MKGNRKDCIIITDAFGRKVRITKERLNHIFVTHPEMKKVENKIPDVLGDPEYLKKSKYNDEVVLYYKYLPSIKKYITVVVKIQRHSFVLTSYMTDRIKKGDTLWRKK